MMKYILQIIVVGFLYYLFNSCASQSSPTGGPKDTIPPTLISSVPPLQSTNFKGRSVTLTFDERIKTNKLKEQLIITPLTTSKYEISLKKNVFKITFDENFNDSTTYTLNFRESIQDLTEGNPTKDNKMTFSTGNYIDSLSISGYVKELLTYDTLKNIIVGLYRAQDTITIFNGSPYYFAELDEDGKYLIENIKNGKYLVYAFTDGNKNLKLETNKESYAFFKDTLLLDTGTTKINLDLIKLDLSELKLMSALASGQYFEINFNKYITDYQLDVINASHEFLSNKVKENKSIRLYNNFDGIDSLQLQVIAQDSVGNSHIDTVYAKFVPSMRKKEEFRMTIKPDDKSSIEQKFTADIVFNKPIISTNSDSIILRYDTIPLYSIPDTAFTWSTNREQLKFDVYVDKVQIDTIEAIKKRIAATLIDTATTEKENQQQIKRQMSSRETKKSPTKNQGIQLYFGKGSFISADKDTSQTIGSNYKLMSPENYGTQQIMITTEYNSFEVQLLKEKFDIIQTARNSKNVKFTNIEPGKYKIRVLIDADEDGKWSPGNMLKQIEPEPVYIYPDLLIIRADWETSLDISF